MLGVRFTLEPICFCTFRVPTATSIIRSYSVPPFTTLRGMLSNAKGLERDYFLLQNEELKIGIKIARMPERIAETGRILKFIARDEKRRPLRRVFPSSPIKKELLFKPAYDIFLVGTDETIKSIFESLDDPLRPLYLGQSDDLVDISSLSKPLEMKERSSSSISSVVEGIHPKCEIIRLPYKYNVAKNASIAYKTFSLPSEYPYDTGREIGCYTFGTEQIAAY